MALARRLWLTRGGDGPSFKSTWIWLRSVNPDVATLVPAPAGRGGGGGRGGAPGGAPPAMVVTSEKLGDGLYRLTTGNGSYDSVIVQESG